jgi:hypothetical protein
LRPLIFDNAPHFADRVTPFLMQREAERNWFLGILGNLPPDAVLCAVEDDRAEIVGVSIMTPPWQMGISSMPTAAVEALADELSRRGIHVPGIQGDIAAAKTFAQRWAATHAVRLRDAEANGIYQLDRVTPPPHVSGTCRVAALNEMDLLLQWSAAFTRDCGLTVDPKIRELLERAVREKRRFLWCDPTPVCMVGVAGPTPNGIRINAVYTPDQFRKRGYASACVAEVSQRMLDSGRRFCFLFTDLANPTSNKIYQAIGYRHVANAQHIAFDPPG